MKIIEDLKLWNKIYYKDCTYNALLSGIYHYNGNIHPFLANDVLSYEYNKDLNIVSIAYINDKKIEELIRDFSFDFINEIEGPSLIEDIINSIDEGNPVFVPYDKYELIKDESENIRRDYEACLIYGYDKENKTFNTISADSYNVFKKDWSFSDLESSYDTFIDYWHNIVNREVYCYRKFIRKKDFIMTEDKNIVKKYKDIYHDNMLKKEDRIINDLNKINLIIENFKSFFEDESRIGSLDIDDYLINFIFIQNGKNIEQYRINEYYPLNFDLTEKLKEIINNLQIIKNLIGMKLMGNKQRSSTIDEGLKEKISLLYDLEMKYYESFYKIIRKTK